MGAVCPLRLAWTSGTLQSAARRDLRHAQVAFAGHARFSPDLGGKFCGMDAPKLIFHTQCRHGHPAQQVFTSGAFERDVAAGTLHFSCATCRERWIPSVEERVRLRALAKRLRRSVQLTE
jgi:hypothetical protein